MKTIRFNNEQYSFKLFVDLYNDERLVMRLHRIFRHSFGDNYELIVIDISAKTEFANQPYLPESPILIRNLPGPPVRVIGDIRDSHYLLAQITHRSLS